MNTFGSIVKKSMLLSEHGIIAMEQWYWLHDQYPYIDLISFVIMPDHVHGIIYIDTDFYKHYVGNGRDRSLQTIDKIKPLPELIGAYKTTVSKRMHVSGDMNFRWQKSYYEHIIRNQRSLNLIKHYIEKNPENWIM
jgi:REP element-mobilizing transposase RayT